MKHLLLIGASSAFLFAACNQSTSMTTTTEASATPEATEMPSVVPSSSPIASPAVMVPSTKTIALSAQNASGQGGTAVLTSTKDGKVSVTLTLKGGKFTGPQPAHIHVGSCPNPGAVKYPLTNVVNGKSVTMLNITMSELLASSDKLAINVHKSPKEISNYTACGDLQ